MNEWPAFSYASVLNPSFVCVCVLTSIDIHNIRHISAFSCFEIYYVVCESIVHTFGVTFWGTMGSSLCDSISMLSRLQTVDLVCGVLMDRKCTKLFLTDAAEHQLNRVLECFTR